MRAAALRPRDNIFARQNLGADIDDAAIDHAERSGRSGTEIEHPAASEWAAIGDGDNNAATGLNIGDADVRSERQGLVGCRESRAAT